MTILTITKAAPPVVKQEIKTEADGSKTHYLGQVAFAIGPQANAQPKG